MRYGLIALTGCLAPMVLCAQAEYSNWYFGDNCGMHFNGLAAPTFQGGSPIQTMEGTATMSDGTGNLLYYTNGETLYNATHGIMLNGSGLLGGQSATQSSLCIQQPGSAFTHYVFTLDHAGYINGLRYSIVDMSLDGGLGGVTADKNIQLETPMTEKIAGCPHQNGIDRWIVVHPWNSGEFHAYLLTAAGLDTVPVVSAVGAFHTGVMQNSYGEMKISPNGNKLALVTNFMNTTELFSFDNNTGIVSSPITLPVSPGEYGISFSPNGTKLYTATFDYGANMDRILQYDITSNDPATIAASQYLVHQDPSEFGGLQIGPDKKIYSAKYNEGSLAVITAPNEAGGLCGYVHSGFSLGGSTCKIGLPNGLARRLEDPTAGMAEGEHAGPILVPDPIVDEGILYLRDARADHWVLMDAVGRVVHSADVGHAQRITVSQRGYAPGMYTIVLLESSRSVATVRCMFQ